MTKLGVLFTPNFFSPMSWSVRIARFSAASLIAASNAARDSPASAANFASSSVEFTPRAKAQRSWLPSSTVMNGSYRSGGRARAAMAAVSATWSSGKSRQT